ncbi:MAG: hypothetical protein L6290_03275 [Thermodesulfovibrionales bacterium]|nr:hypothetical protein [Thermodesulfovibrionales bacterium]
MSDKVIQLYKKAYAEFWEIAQRGGYEFCSLVPYEYERNKSLGLIYDEMEPYFTREIINSINAFAEHIGTISIWDMVISKYDADDQFELRYEFLKLPMYFCLNQPRAIKERIIFCATHLCHQANLEAVKIYKDDLPDDRSLGEKELQKRISNWSAGNELMSTLSNMSSSKFRKAAKNYRNMTHHRIPPDIEYGLTSLVNRKGYQEDTIEYIAMEDGNPVKKKMTSKEVTYACGGVEPIKASKILPDLKTECENGKKAFYAYWKMVNEHVRVLKPDIY